MGVLILKYPCSAKEFALRLAYNGSPYFCRTPPKSVKGAKIVRFLRIFEAVKSKNKFVVKNPLNLYYPYFYPKLFVGNVLRVRCFIFINFFWLLSFPWNNATPM